MPKTKISEFSATPGNNTDIDGINIAEGCAPSGINDAIRELMAQLKDFQAGTAGDSFNGPVGTTTAAAGAFTTLTTSSTVTHNGGTANGVAYLNGSKVLTTGSALTFDGTSIFGVTSSTVAVAKLFGGTGAGNGSYFALYAQGANAGYVGTDSGITGGGTSNDLTLYPASTNNIRFYQGGSEQARLTSTGLGVGTSTPAEKLQVNGTAALFNNTAGTFDLKLYQTDRYDGRITVNSSGMEISQRQALPLLFLTSDTERARITSGGDVGIGTSSISERLVVNGNASVDVYKLRSNTATPASTDSFIYRPADNTLAFGTASTERARIDSSGNLQLGATSGTGNRLNVVGTGGIRVNEDGSGTKVITIRSDFAGIGPAINVTTNDPLLLQTNNTERARITSGGAFCAGTTSVVSVAGLNGAHSLRTDTNSNWATSFAHGGTTPYGLGLLYVNAAPNGTGNEFLYCYDSAPALRMSVRSNGGIANYSANDVNLSDRREKTNFAPAKSYLDTICAIPVQTFNYIDQSEDDPGLTLGVVAQDVQAVAPELVMESNWGTKEDPKMRLSIYQTDLQYALMKCIQEQQVMINELKAKVAALEAK